jgi:serine/threonine protein kinase
VPASSPSSFLEFLPLRYQVEQVLSQGDAGATLRVLDTGLRQSAAVVKIQHLPDAGGDKNVEDDFLRFCSELCSLKHPNIGTPYTYGTFRDGSGALYGYTTRPFIHGLSLAEMRRPLDERSVIRAGVQICQGLELLHDNGLRHHDLKLENVVVRRAGDGDIDELSQCVLIDLSYRPRTDRDQTALSEVTLQYVAPELLAGEEGDVQSDLYSLGVLLYAALTGELPFPGESVAEIIRNQRSRHFVPIHEKRNDVCPQLRRVVERLLEPHPQNRAATAAATIAAIEECDDRGSAPLPMIRRPRWGSVFSGRQEELADCLAALSPQRRGHTDACIEVRGAPQSGVTSFLRELQDRLEAGGVTILTASPQAVCGSTLQAQLFVPVHRLVRRSSESGKGMAAALQERRVAESSTDLHPLGSTRQAGSNQAGRRGK